MKNIFTITLLFIFAAGALAQDIENYSLEKWTSKTQNGFTFEDPDEFNTSNPYMAQINQSNVTKSSDAHFGAHSAKLENMYVGLLSVTVPGVLAYGQIGLDGNYNPTFGPGKPFADRPDTISAYVKYDPDGADTFGVFAVLTKWNSASNSRDTIGFGSYQNGNTINSWTGIDMAMNYTSMDTPDSILLVFLSSTRYQSSSAPASSVLHVDGIHTSNMTSVGMAPFKEKLDVEVYPNPAQDNIHFRVNVVSEDLVVNIYNVLGMKVDSRAMENGELAMDVSRYDKGLYFYEIKGKNDRTMKTGKFNVAR